MKTFRPARNDRRAPRVGPDRSPQPGRSARSTPGRRRFALLATTIFFAAHSLSAAEAGSADGYGELAMGPPGVLFVVEPGGSGIRAVSVSSTNAEPAPFNLDDLGARLARALEAPEAALRIADLAMVSGSARAYISGAVIGEGASRPFLAAIEPSGAVELIDVEERTLGRMALSDLPSAELDFWGETPSRALTITDVLWTGDDLYVAGLSNRRFASTLRRFTYPFESGAEITTVEIFHTVHNQIETRAPIRTMAVATLGGKPYLLAAYTCTPLVLIPLAELQDGAHVRGKTIAELGYGNTPVDLIVFDVVFPGQTPQPTLLVTGTERGGDVIPMAAVAAAASRPGLERAVRVPLEVTSGLPSAPAPLGSVLQIVDQDEMRLLAVRRDRVSGALELVSIQKGLYFRLSDFVNEYDFSDYAYPADDAFQQDYIRPVHGLMKRDEGHGELVK